MTRSADFHARELEPGGKGLDSQRYTIRTAPSLLRKLTAWADYCEGERSLAAAIKRLATIMLILVSPSVDLPVNAYPMREISFLSIASCSGTAMAWPCSDRQNRLTRGIPDGLHPYGGYRRINRHWPRVGGAMHTERVLIC